MDANEEMARLKGRVHDDVNIGINPDVIIFFGVVLLRI